MRPMLLMLCVAGLTACDGPRPDPDGGAIVVPDGAQPDAGQDGGQDGGTDAGSGWCGSTRADPRHWAPLPETCLPRCRGEARDPYFACTTSDCAITVLSADPTPQVVVDTPVGDYAVACGWPEGRGIPCVLWQGFSCDAEYCPDEYLAWLYCSSERPDCDAEVAALDACRSASAELRACNGERRAACFGS